ncbi:hypothetical protein NSB24_07520 [Blautia coccoides]|uniref:DUF7768 domain-containing protein n=2 Tax=Blautia producta TaxID=33035 RepID=A0A7G5MZI7_9FIRM|nr:MULTISPECIES: DUF4406 domain-containing protein [Blautia]MCR1986063.1 hypothetical protein [Blautia coccoides]MDU5221305.1 DUF4406 domain-containing protein [Blautia producta]MDU5382637.1 DUF4406 domain-containing protein [Blautia producta]QIB57194.1 hypothetical protein GXM18_21485 [Blautia producta ATCC 27340 = DSM 2950]QMW80030.1 hypothetical protein E5259_21930 [Blautia producta]
MRKKIFICSPFRGDVKGNSAKAAGYCRRAYEEGCLPIAPHLLFPQFLNEDSLKERVDGIAMGMDLLLGCDEMWVFGEATEGMEQEIRFAVEHGIHIWFKEDAEGGRGHEAGNGCYETDRE